VSWLERVVEVVQVSGALAAPLHFLTVTVELVNPVARSRLLTTVTSHDTASPPTLPVLLHWETADVAPLAMEEAPSRPAKTSTAVTASRAATSRAPESPAPAVSRRPGEWPRGVGMEITSRVGMGVRLDRGRLRKDAASQGLDAHHTPISASPRIGRLVPIVKNDLVKIRYVSMWHIDPA